MEKKIFQFFEERKKKKEKKRRYLNSLMLLFFFKYSFTIRKSCLLIVSFSIQKKEEL